MALLKAVPTEFGINATYWHILAVQVNRPQGSALVTLAGYLDGEARRAGHHPLAVTTLTFLGGDYPGSVDGIRYDAIYGLLKQLKEGDKPSFVGALDA